jgi:hypothetical protein
MKFGPRAVQPVASTYTDWAIPAHIPKNTLPNFYSFRICYQAYFSGHKLDLAPKIQIQASALFYGWL